MDVRVYSTNTDRLVVETVEVDEAGEYEEDGDYIIPGVSTTGSEVKCAFIKPAGSMTGKLFPSDQPQQTLRVKPRSLLPSREPFDVRVSLVDAANPFVLIDATSISTILKTVPSDDVLHRVVESIRREGAVAMGLATTVHTAAHTRGTPKVALVYPPPLLVPSNGDKAPDVRVQAYSMGLPHPSLQLTGAVCLASALCMPGTVVAGLSRKAAAAVAADDEAAAPVTPERTPSPVEREEEAGSSNSSSGDEEEERGPERQVVIAHSKGTIRVGVVMTGDGRGVASCAVSRTARRLFEGRVRYYVQEG